VAGVIYGLGPRARRVFTVLHDRIVRGDWAPGTRLPSHRELAVEFGVAPLTMRQVLAQLEEQGLVSRQVGRGTFVREESSPAVLIVENGLMMGAFLADYVGRTGYRALVASRLADALTILAKDEAIILVLCDLETSDAQDGAETMRSLRSRYPQLPIAALVADLADLSPLFGTAEWPLHILPKPISLGLLDDLLRLVALRPVRSD
jgi:DNA-binding transcriptional regulator YhcF (GntR family)